MSKSEVHGFQEMIKTFKMLGGDFNASAERVITLTANKAMQVAKENTPRGQYPDTVEFTTKEGKRVSFKVTQKQGGTLIKSWHMGKLKKSKRKITKEFNNVAEYAMYVNNGHRIVRKGVTIGYVNPQYFLEKGMAVADQAMDKLFQLEVERLKKKHGL